MSKQFISKLIPLSLGVLVLCFLVGSVILAAWTEPTQAPPGGNVPPPGDITAVNAGAGLTGGGLAGSVTLAVNVGSITGAMMADNTIEWWDTNVDSVQRRVLSSCPAGQSIRAITNTGAVTCEIDDAGGIADCTACDARFVNEGQSNSITGAMIMDDQVTSADIATAAVGSTEIVDGTITHADTNVDSVQRRVTGFCGPQAIGSINRDGTVNCVAVGGTLDCTRPADGWCTAGALGGECTATVSCPWGRATGGGIFDGATTVGGGDIHFSWPSPDNMTWNCYHRNRAVSSSSISCWVRCCRIL